MSLELLQRVVESGLKLERNELMNRSRRQHIVDARKIFAYTAYKMGYTKHKIAKYLRLDRSTIYHAVESAEDLMKFDNAFRQEINRIMDEANKLMYKASLDGILIDAVIAELKATIERLENLKIDGGGDVLS